MRYLILILSLFSITLPSVAEEKAKPVIALIPKGSAHVFWKSVESGALKAGDFIGIAGQTKVYMVTADVSADAFGLATVPIEPGLLAVPADGAVMTLRNVPFTVALGADTMESVVGPGAIYNFSLQLVEAF